MLDLKLIIIDVLIHIFIKITKQKIVFQFNSYVTSCFPIMLYRYMYFYIQLQFINLTHENLYRKKNAVSTTMYYHMVTFVTVLFCFHGTSYDHLLKTPWTASVVYCLMVSMHTSSKVDCGFKPWWGHTKEYNISICWLLC